MKTKLLSGVLAASIFAAFPVDAQTVRIAFASLPPGNGNPFVSTARTSWYTWRAIFDTLTQLGPGMAPAPALAVSWKNTTPNTWIVNLRGDTAFSNGEPMNAEAVIATVKYLQSPQGSLEQIAKEVENIAVVRAVDTLTLEFTTKQPDPMFPRSLTALPIVPPVYWAKVGRDGFALAPVGTGSFIVESWGSTQVKMKANPQSWRAPKAERAEIVILPETSTRVQALLSGRIDIASEIGPEDIEALEDAGLTYYHRPASAIEVIAFNVLIDSPLKDVRVRQALNHAVDRQAIADSLMNGLAPPASQMTARANPEYDNTLTPYSYDPAKAKALLAEAGYAKGFSFVTEISGGTAGSHYTGMMQKVADDVAKIGVKMEVRPIPWSQYVRGVQQGEWKSQAFGFEYETMPTGETLRPFRLHSCTWAHPWYCDASLTPVIAEAKNTFDPKRRIALVHRILREYRDKAAALILVESVGIDGLSKNVRGYSQVNNIIPYQDLTVSK